MSDEKVIADVKQPTAEPQGVKTEAVAEDVKQESQSIPYTRFKEVLDSKKSLESEIATLKEAEEAKRKKDLETQGEYKQLLTETETKLEQAVQKAAQWDDYQTARRETLLAQLSESDAAIYGGMPLDKLESHVDKTKHSSPTKVEGGKAGVLKAPNKPIGDMTKTERRESWPAIIDGFRKGTRSN